MRTQKGSLGYATLHVTLVGLGSAALLPIRTSAASTVTKAFDPQTILYGVAYYEEYAPYDRLNADVQMMKSAGITVVRIGESTWGTLEPQDGVFDYSHIDRVIKAMADAGIRVIVGTPTYAIPTWLAREHPDVLAITPTGPSLYGQRQNMDITNVHFRFYAGRVIRRFVGHVSDQPAVIGFQLDNESKSYHVSGPDVQRDSIIGAIASTHGKIFHQSTGLSTRASPLHLRNTSAGSLRTTSHGKPAL